MNIFQRLEFENETIFVFPGDSYHQCHFQNCTLVLCGNTAVGAMKGWHEVFFVGGGGNDRPFFEYCHFIECELTSSGKYLNDKRV